MQNERGNDENKVLAKVSRSVSSPLMGKAVEMRPRVVCICGSTRFRKEIAEANRGYTMRGYVVLAPGVFQHDGDPLTESQKSFLDDLHLRKIDMADEVFVVNPGDYIGSSTAREINYANQQNVPVVYLERGPR